MPTGRFVLTQMSPIEPEAQNGPIPPSGVDGVFFNALHPAAGAFASFTLGAKGASGGLGLELGGPADEDVFIGVESDRLSGVFEALPFYGPQTKGGSHFGTESTPVAATLALTAFPDNSISRTFGAGIDEWRAGDLTFRVVSPAKPVPDPVLAHDEDLRFALVPAVVAELTLDNSRGTRTRRAFFGYAGSIGNRAMRAWEDGGMTGVGQGCAAIATDDPEAYARVGFEPEAILSSERTLSHGFMLGRTGMIVSEAMPGEVKTIRLAIGWFREGNATEGTASRYLYRRLFASMEKVLAYALSSFERLESMAQEQDRRLARALSPERFAMIAAAIRSYYGSTQCLELADERPLWVVNEGEYRMMNTLDLMPDQAPFELALNPWTVRSELDFYLDRHSYEDRVRAPGDAETHPGGIAFTHDVGVASTFAEPGTSAYELAGRSDCFSFMSCEELVNWTLCACLYALRAGDRSWLRDNANTLASCLESLINRDDADCEKRNGVMSLDSDRCRGGSEITTYDSLDASLGQARGSLYLAVKSWAAYALLAETLLGAGQMEACEQAKRQALLCAGTIARSAGETGVLPANLNEPSLALVIPAIEGLAFPAMLGKWDCLSEDGPYGSLVRALRTHFERVMASGACRFADGGWRLSSTSANSWLSKIYLCQYVAERVFGCEPDRAADFAHLGWLLREGNRYYAWSDQMLNGIAVGSRYYPRGVTAALWLEDIEALLYVAEPDPQEALT